MATAPQPVPGVGERVVATIFGRPVEGVVADPPEWEDQFDHHERVVPVAVEGGSRFRVPLSDVTRR